MRLVKALLVAGLLCAASVAWQRRAEDAQSLDAIEAGERAVRLAPDSEADRISLATLYLMAGQDRRAVETLRDYSLSRPNSAKVWRLLATAYLRQEEYTAAKDCAAKALRAGPRDAAGVHVLAMAHLGLQDVASAERLFRESLKLEPNSVDSNFQLGLLYTKQHANPEEAIRLLKKARALQPRMAGIHTALGSALLQSGKPEVAARSLETAMELAPDDAETYYVAADAYRRLGLDRKAEAALAEFNTRNAALADQRAREMRSRAYYQQGADLLANTDQLDKAYDLLEKAVREMPALDAGYYRMAQIRYLKGDLKGASSRIREALRLNALEPEYYYVLARCLESSEPHRALDAVRTAVALRPGVADFQELLRALEPPKNP